MRAYIRVLWVMLAAELGIQLGRLIVGDPGTSTMSGITFTMAFLALYRTYDMEKKP